MRVLVCGGRDFIDQELVNRTLDALDPKPTRIICGGASGADECALRWAVNRKIPQAVYPARWQEHGRAAGPIRNQEMLDKEKPDLVIAFPGGPGTRNMITLAARAGVQVRGVSEYE